VHMRAGAPRLFTAYRREHQLRANGPELPKIGCVADE